MIVFNSFKFSFLSELHNQKYERKRGYSVPSTPKNASRGAENRVSQSDGPRKKRAAAISAGKETEKKQIFNPSGLIGD